MKRVHIDGRKNHGKTSLMLRLVHEMTRSGYRVGTIKHTRHVHELDKAGSDSHRRRYAGSAAAAVVTGDLIGVVLQGDLDIDAYQRLAPLYADCDLVLVEGDLDARGPEIEVWRENLGTPCIATERSDFVPVVTDDHNAVDVPIVRPGNIRDLPRHLHEVARSGHIRRGASSRSPPSPPPP